MIPAAITAAAGLASVVGNNAFQKQRYQQQLADERKNWYLQNQYNSPSAQMERLKIAGLNPNLVYQNGGAVQPSGEMSLPNYEYTPIDGASLAGQAFQSMDIVQDARVKSATADQIESGRPYWDKIRQREVSKLDAEIHSQNEHTKLLGKQVGLTDAQITNELQKTPILRAEFHNLRDQHKINKQTLENLEQTYHILLNERDISARNVALAELNLIMQSVLTGAEARKNGYWFNGADFKIYETDTFGDFTSSDKKISLWYDEEIDTALKMFKEQYSTIKRDNSYLNRVIGYGIGVGNMVGNFLPTKHVSSTIENMTIHDKWGKPHQNRKETYFEDKYSKSWR